MTRQAQVPKTVQDHFGARYEHDYATHPIIVQTFRPGVGWKRYTFRKRVSTAWLRKMKADGYTHVGLAIPGDERRVADFEIASVLRIEARYQRNVLKPESQWNASAGRWS